MTELDYLKGKRLGALDYGRKRVGFAVCDELHIVVSPRRVFDFSSDTFWEEILGELTSEKIAALVVGVPYRLDEQETDVISEIFAFINDLKEKTGLEVFEFDESFSTVRSAETMLAIGKKKKKRAEKGNKDKIAAAIILRDFIQEKQL
jgi:putative Holliday junction resolvase